MGRNLCRSTCYFCDGQVYVNAGESPHSIRPDEAGNAYESMKGVLVAAAQCRDCEASYLAWFSYPSRPEVPPDYREDGSIRPLDLSFRSTFHERPGLADMPQYVVQTIRQRLCLEGIPIVEFIDSTSNEELVRRHLDRFGKER